MGKMISSAQQREELKRKRRLIERRQVENELRDDKVWLPNFECTNEEHVPVGKE